MSYAAQIDEFSRTPQDLIVIGVRGCQNHYAALVEQLFTRTEEFDHADWVKTSVAVATDDAEAPDGTTTAETLTYSATNDATTQTPASTIVTSKSFTASIWLRVTSGTNTVTLRLRNAGSTESKDKQVTITTTWTRFFVHKLFTGTPVDNLVFVLIRLAGDDVAAVEVWGANCSQNPAAQDLELTWPYRKRVAETVSTVSVNASRCEAADAGDGNRCYYSRPSCQDPDNFNIGNSYEATPELKGFREYRFCKNDAPLALTGENVAPLIDRFDLAGQEIDPKLGVTVTERVGFTFFDDVGPGVWNPTQQGRAALVNTATGAGTFWRRFLAINRNYANPAGYLILKVGFVEAGVAESDYQQRGKFIMRNIVVRPDEKVTIDCTDRLKITKKSIPAQITDTNRTVTIINSSDTTITVDDAGEVSKPAANAAGADPDYFVIIEVNYDQAGSNKDEKMTVTDRDLVNNTLTVLRGRWGTPARNKHADGSKFREVAEFGTERSDPAGIPFGKNPLDIIRELYRYAGIADEDIDNTQFDSERDLWLFSSIDLSTADEAGVLFRRTLTKPLKVEELIRQIRELVMLLVWIDENQMVTCKLFAPPIPTETIVVLDDDSNIVEDTLTIDDADESRLTRAFLAFDLDPAEDGNAPEDYNLIEVYIALDEEEEAYYGEQLARVILTEWLRATDLLNPGQLVSRIVNRFRFGARMFKLSLEVKDDSIKVGQTVEIRTDKLQKFDGSVDPRFAVIIKKKRGRRLGVFDLDAIEMPFARVFFWAPDGLPVYDSSTDANKRYGYYSDDQGLVGTVKELGYHYW